jgi:hypothetical protein
MIAETPVASASNYHDLAGKVTAFLVAAKTAAAGGLTWIEFGELTLALLRLTTESLEQVRTLSGQAKKELALEAVAALFDTVADKCIPTLAWPAWALMRPAIRSLILALASGAIEQLLPLIRS